jgi:hypothetical protein
MCQSSFKRKRRWRAQTDGLVARCATIHEATSDGEAHSKMHDTSLLDWAGASRVFERAQKRCVHDASHAQQYVSPVAESWAGSASWEGSPTSRSWMGLLEPWIAQPANKGNAQERGLPLHDGRIRCGLLVPASAVSLPCCRAWNVMEAQRSVRDVRRYASSRRERRGATNACRLEYPQGDDVMHCQYQSTVRQQESRSVPAAGLSGYKGSAVASPP